MSARVEPIGDDIVVTWDDGALAVLQRDDAVRIARAILTVARLGQTHSSVDHALAAQRAAERHLEAIWAAVWAGLEPDTSAPFCECVTCLVRETLTAAAPHLRRLWEEGP